MNDIELKKYQKLNEFAEVGGIVIFGGTEDRMIPTAELKQAFEIEEKVYNRSVKDLSVLDACSAYKTCVEELAPETVLLHIGEADEALFKADASSFDCAYEELISYIKSKNSKCRIGIISLCNVKNDVTISEMNKHLKTIADSHCCDYMDIASKHVWNPKSFKESVSFMYSMGFVRPLKCQRPIYDLMKLFFVSLA